MSIKINISILCILAVFLLGTGMVHAASGSKTSGSSNTKTSGSSNKTTTTAKPGIIAATNSGSLASQTAQNINSGKANVKVPPGYQAVVVAGNINGQTYGVSIQQIPSSNHGNGNGNGSAPPANLSLASDRSSYVIGQTVQLTWVPQNVLACTASGDWTGAKANSNTSHVQAIVPAAVGTYTYSLSCVGLAVTLTRQVTVTVNPATDVMPANMSVTKACTQTSCSTANLQFAIQNTGASIANGVAVPYLVQYRVSTSNVWLTGAAGSWTGGIANGAMSPTIPVTITGLTYSNYKVRIVINSPSNSQLGETNFSDNTSPEFDLSVAPNPTLISFNAVDTVVRFNTGTLLDWTITSDFPTTCQVSGAGLSTNISHVPNITTSSVATPLLKNQQNFSISCNAQNINGFLLPAVRNTLQIDVVPNVQEI